MENAMGQVTHWMLRGVMGLIAGAALVSGSLAIATRLMAQA
jgi:hypothetical protein